ncbi:MAG TPA: LuxR C-terminal-related transcriptional regulator, partial [Flavipsychrobacter sp.]|nr:LuxR C-terminal-related transcriptional regulator [Flavipsychrobacter sp.]
RTSIFQIFGGITYKCVFTRPNLYVSILDFTQNAYVEIGPGKDTFVGYTTEYLKDGGPFFWMEQSDKRDMRILNEKVIPGEIALLQGLQQSELDNVVCSTNYRTRTRSGDYITVLQRGSYLCDEAGRLLGIVGTIENISPFKSDNKIINVVEKISADADGHLKREVLQQQFYFPEEKDSLLTKREIEILRWICAGLNSREIAERLFISVNTVNNHRKSILQKTNAKNMMEVLQYTISNGII